jgi:hypothetical protein
MTSYCLVHLKLSMKRTSEDPPRCTEWPNISIRMRWLSDTGKRLMGMELARDALKVSELKGGDTHGGGRFRYRDKKEKPTTM